MIRKIQRYESRLSWAATILLLALSTKRCFPKKRCEMLRNLYLFFLVGVGGMIGSMLRYGTTVLTKDLSFSIPFGTLISNVAGCFLIGVVTSLAEQRAVLSGEARLFLATGICGGFTTLSSLVYEMQKLVANREFGVASLYFTTTFVGSFIAFFIGMVCVRLFVKG
jgi:fluoride exporter